MMNKKYTIILAFILLTGAAAFVANAAGIVMFSGDYTRGSNDGLILDVNLAQSNYNSGAKRFTDASGLGNNGISTNAATFAADNDGKNAGAMNFNGTSDCVNSPISYGDSYTISAWVNPNDFTTVESYGRTVFASSVSVSYPSWLLIHDSSTIRAYAYATGSACPATGCAELTYNFSAGKWYNIVLTATRQGTASVYVNGEFIGSFTAGNQAPHAQVTVGSLRPGRGIAFSGVVSQVKMYNRALSAIEVRNLYKPRAAVSSLQAGLVGYWPLDGDNYNATTGRVNDKTPYGNNGANHGATLTTDRMGRANGAMGFAANAYINASSLYNTNFPQTAGSIALWVYGDFSTQNLKSIFDDYSDARRHLFIRTNTSNNGLQIVLQKPSVYIASSYPVLENNKWSFLTVTYNTVTDNMKVYINGAQFSSSSMSDTSWVPDGQIVAFGGISNRFTGSMSDVRVYNRELSATEISTLYGAYSPKIISDSLQQDLVLDMPLTSKWVKTETVGSQIMTDKTPYSNDGQNYGATIASDGAMFNGSSSYIYRSILNNTVSSNMTWFAWVKTSSATNQSIIQQSRSASIVNGEYVYQLSSNGRQNFWDYNNGFGFSTSGNSLTVLNDGSWHQVAFVKNGVNGVYYLDGKPDGTKTAAKNNSTNSSDLTIGKDYRDGNQFFNGQISDIKIYNRALSAAEIKSLYDKGR